MSQHMKLLQKWVVKRRVTFLDTPGHEAFQTLRAHWRKSRRRSDPFVSAEDGVKPQTIEALKWIKEQSVPFVVAINKIDRPNANVDRTKLTLAENEVYVEGYGGTVSSVPVSAKTGEGIPELQNSSSFTTDVLDLKGNPDNLATGVVIEKQTRPTVRVFLPHLL